MNEKLLVVEESPTLRVYFRKMLERQNRDYVLTIVESLKEAREKLTEDDASYDVLVLVTEEEPELVEFVRQSMRFKLIPVIMICREETHESKARKLKALFLQRPFPLHNFDIFIESARELMKESDGTILQTSSL